MEVGQKERLALRVVAQGLAQAKKASQHKGRKLSAATTERLRWNLYLTNVSERVLSGYQVGLVYHLRWQIELLFKLWKSGLGLEQNQNKKMSRVRCESYARLIGYTLLVYTSWGVNWAEEVEEAEETSLVEALVGSSVVDQHYQTDKAELATGVISPYPLVTELIMAQPPVKMSLPKQRMSQAPRRELSLPKALQSLQLAITKLGKAIAKGNYKKLKKVIKRLRENWQRYGLKEARADRPSSYQQVRQSALSTRNLQGCLQDTEQKAA